MCKPWDRAPWNRKSNLRSLSQETPPGQGEEQRVHKGREQADLTSSGTRYTQTDDAKIRQLKEQGLSWIAIAEDLPGRTVGAIEVSYQTKLKTADPSRSGSQQLYDHSRALSPVVGDDSGEEREVEEICGDRRRDDGGLELLVKWKGGEET